MGPSWGVLCPVSGDTVAPEKLRSGAKSSRAPAQLLDAVVGESHGHRFLAHGAPDALH